MGLLTAGQALITRRPSRTAGTMTFPSQFMLVAAVNPDPERPSPRLRQVSVGDKPVDEDLPERPSTPIFSQHEHYR